MGTDARPVKPSPPGWPAADLMLAQLRSPELMGLKGSVGDVNRFNSRYRLAKSFRSIELDDYHPNTVAGYNALFRVFLVWSTFELFMRIMGYRAKSLGKRLGPYDPDALAKAIRAVDKHQAFLKFLHSELTAPTHKEMMASFIAGENTNILIVPLALRHIFAHGSMTPNSGARDCRTTCGIADPVCEFLFKVMDREFLARLKKHRVYPELLPQGD